MAHPSSSADAEQIRQVVAAAYRWVGDGTSSDAILCCSEKRSEFDFYVRAVANHLGVTITTYEAHRALLQLRQLSLLRSSVAI